MPVAPVVFALAAAGGTAILAGRNQQQKAKSGATTQMRSANAQYQQQKQDARNNNQAPNTNALKIARQQEVMRLQQGSGRASTFLSNGLGG